MKISLPNTVYNMLYNNATCIFTKTNKATPCTICYITMLTPMLNSFLCEICYESR